MAWTAPMTAVANTAFTAAQFNTYVRDNFLQTAPALATTAGSLFVGVGSNSIAERIPKVADVTTGESTSSTSYTDLATVGPTVTVSTGTSALVFWCATANNTTGFPLVGYAVSGASTVSASDTQAANCVSASSATSTISKFNLQTGLTAGTNVFTLQYKATSGTSTFQRRRIIVIPL
jgi:hypothetical protein